MRSVKTAAMESNIVDENHRACRGAVCREMEDVGIAFQNWKVLRLSDDRMDQYDRYLPRRFLKCANETH